MEHFAEHPHAFIVGDTVKLVAVFAEHDEFLINTIREANQCDYVVCCCNVGVIPSAGWSWTGTEFVKPITDFISEEE